MCLTPPPPTLPRQGGHGVDRDIPRAVQLYHNATALGSWRAPHHLLLLHADGVHGLAQDPLAARAAFWSFMALTSGWKEQGRAAAKRHSEGDAHGAVLRYALVAEQGCQSATANLAWLLHRGAGPHRTRERHRLALPLWERGVARNQTESMLMAGHLLLRGDRFRLQGGELRAGYGMRRVPVPACGAGAASFSPTASKSSHPSQPGCTPGSAPTTCPPPSSPLSRRQCGARGGALPAGGGRWLD